MAGHGKKDENCRGWAPRGLKFNKNSANARAKNQGLQGFIFKSKLKTVHSIKKCTVKTKSNVSLGFRDFPEF